MPSKPSDHSQVRPRVAAGAAATESADAVLSQLHQPLRGHDRFFLELESESNSLNVGGLVRLRNHRPDALVDDLRQLLAGRIHLMPKLRQKLAEVTLPSAPHVWVDDASFTVEGAVKVARFAEPPDRAAVLAYAGQLVSQPLPRDRYLWDLTVIPHTTFGESAVVARWHHALVDGMSSIEFGKLLFSPTDEIEHVEPKPWSPQSMPAPAELVAESLAVAADEQLRSALSRTAASSDSLEQFAKFQRFIDGILSFLDLGSMPPNPFSPESTRRRYATASVPSEVLRSIQRRFDLTLETAVYLVISGAVAALLSARGDEADALRVMLPVTRISRGRSTQLGNHGSFTIADLPVGPMEPADRALRISEHLATVKASKQAEAASALIAGAEALPPAVSAKLGQWTNERSFVHAIVSYMRGPRRQLFIAGREHFGTYPLLPRTSAVGLLIGVMNLGGYASFGLVADPHAVPDLQFLATAIDRVANELAYPDP